eukprot:g4453.t1
MWCFCACVFVCCFDARNSRTTSLISFCRQAKDTAVFAAPRPVQSVFLLWWSQISKYILLPKHCSFETQCPRSMFTTNASRACVFRQGALLRSTARCASRCISFLPKPIAHAAPKSCSASSLLLGGATALAVGLSTASTLLADEKKEEMCYRMLGNTGLQVSVLGFGFFANYGTKKDLMDQAGIDMAKASLRLARDAGVNLFDNAETYGNPQGAA